MGLERARKQGKCIGRKKGCDMPYKLEGKEKEIIRKLKSGTRKTDLCRQLGISRPTLDKFIKDRDLKF